MNKKVRKTGSSIVGAPTIAPQPTLPSTLQKCRSFLNNMADRFNRELSETGRDHFLKLVNAAINVFKKR